MMANTPAKPLPHLDHLSCICTNTISDLGSEIHIKIQLEENYKSIFQLIAILIDATGSILKLVT